jgi:hypothetical protein
LATQALPLLQSEDTFGRAVFNILWNIPRPYNCSSNFPLAYETISSKLDMCPPKVPPVLIYNISQHSESIIEMKD